MLRNAPSVVVSRESARAARHRGTGTATRKPATTLADVVVSRRESVSPLEVAMADLAMELGREKLRASAGSTEAATRGWAAATGSAHRMWGSTGRRRPRGRRVRGGTAGGSGRVLVPRPYVPAADHDVSAPERVEARAVVVKLDADGALPPEMYADIRREYLATGPPDARKRDGYDRIPKAAIARVEERRRTTRGARARSRRRRRIRTRGLIGTRESFTETELSRPYRAYKNVVLICLSRPRQLSFKYFLTHEAQLRTMSIPMSERPAAQVSTSEIEVAPRTHEQRVGPAPTPSLRPATQAC